SVVWNRSGSLVRASCFSKGHGDMRHLRNLLVILFQAGVAAISLAAAYEIRLDFSLSPAEWRLLANVLMIAVPIKLCSFYVGRLHRGSWRHAALPDLIR